MYFIYLKSIGIAIVSAGQSLYSHWVSLAKLSDSYRAHYTMKQVWHSAFAIHNETVSLNHSNQQGNIWTHLFAFFVFIGLSIFTGTIEWHPAESAIDKAVMTIFTLSASYTFLSSSLFHLHICHSQKLYSIFVCLDYTGISALIAGSSIALIYLLFYCQPVARNVWCSLIVLVNAAGVCGTMFRGCLGPRYRSVRTSIFVMSSVLIFLPVIHFAVTKGIDGFPDPSTNFAGVGFLLMVLFYVLGVCIYIFKVPER
jgi:adiponectin receptor